MFGKIPPHIFNTIQIVLAISPIVYYACYSGVKAVKNACNSGAYSSIRVTLTHNIYCLVHSCIVLVNNSVCLSSPAPVANRVHCLTCRGVASGVFFHYFKCLLTVTACYIIVFNTPILIVLYLCAVAISLRVGYLLLDSHKIVISPHPLAALF